MQLDCNTLHSKLSPAQLENVLLTSPSSLDNVVIPTFPREQLGDVQCTDCGLQTNYLFFTGPPNLSAGIFPTTVNGKKGTESGGSKSDCRTNMFDVKIRKKYYARNEPGTKYVVTLYQISPIGNAAQTYYLYQFKVAQFRNNKSAFIATKHVNNCVQAQPLQYTNKSVPSIQSVSPCEFEHKPHAKEMLTVTGENLQFSAGYLYRAATGTYIPMKVFSERTCTELRLEFVQPAQLYTCVDEYVIFSLRT